MVPMVPLVVLIVILILSFPSFCRFIGVFVSHVLNLHVVHLRIALTAAA